MSNGKTGGSIRLGDSTSMARRVCFGVPETLTKASRYFSRSRVFQIASRHVVRDRDTFSFPST